jgi:hypothetical protein
MLLRCLPILLAGGCSWLHRGGASPLSPLSVAGDSVLLEVLFVRLPPAEIDRYLPLWNDVDEQQLPIASRQRLAANGFRVGLVASRLPPLLEGLLNQEEVPKPTNAPKPPKPANGERMVDVGKEPTVRGYQRQVRVGEPREIVPGQKDPYPQLTVLIRNDDGDVTGEVFKKAKPMFVERVYPTKDGRVRLELLPEIVYGDPQKQFLPGDDGTLQFQVLPPRKAFDRLRIEATLAPGQSLLIGGRPEHEGSLGSRYFTEPSADGPRQQLLLIRLAQAKDDHLFVDDTADGNGN